MGTCLHVNSAKEIGIAILCLKGILYKCCNVFTNAIKFVEFFTKVYISQQVPWARCVPTLGVANHLHMVSCNEIPLSSCVVFFF